MKSNGRIESPSPRVIPSPPYADHALKVGPTSHIKPRVDKRS
jgi:hypothetical protein